ncbi:MAG: class I SAM-dependent methyltransferase [Candidatus Shapirobacteria bacterium]|jgi:ubiquinone/menaquinone biosynthesis C-methylase UbiE
MKVKDHKIIELGKSGKQFIDWGEKNPYGQIPLGVAKEGAGENRIPLTHYANSVPVYLVFKGIIERSKKDNAFVLDLGCGTGRNISFVKDTVQKNYSYYGVDYSESCIDFARKQYGKKGVQYVQYQGPILPFPDKCFDFVVSSHVIEHIPKDKAEFYLEEVSRVLKEGGVAVIGTPNRKFCQDLFAINKDDKRKYRFVLPHEHEYYHDEIRKLFEKVKAFGTYEIWQSYNKMNRRLMVDSTNRVKPASNLFGKIRFFVYSLIRSSSKLQDLVARLGSEWLMRGMKVNYRKILSETKVYLSDKDEGDNLIVIVVKQPEVIK